MWKFIVRRILLGILIIFFGALICYTIMRCLPSSYVENIARERTNKPGARSYTEILAELNAAYSMDKGIIAGFFSWGSNALRGEWGKSWFYGVSVTEKFGSVIWYSVALNIITLFLEVIICIPLGILAARKQYSKTDYTVTVISLACISLPTFFLAMVLKYIFSIQLGWVDLYGIVGRYYNQLDGWGKFLDMAKHMILPITTLTMLHMGRLTRYTRTNMLEVLNADYIRTARAKGLPEKRVINHHAFRNTLIPLVTFMSLLIPDLFSGSLITETLFQIPGIGWTSYQALVGGDIPFAMFYMVFLTVLTQVSLLLADIMYAVVDPRVRIN